MAVLLGPNPTQSYTFKFIFFASVLVLSLLKHCEAGSYYAEADTLDLPTLDAYDVSLLAPSPVTQAHPNLISSPPDISPSPSPHSSSPVSDSPHSGPSPAPNDPLDGPNIGQNQARVTPTGAPRHSWGREYALWCVARPTVPETMLQRAMDYACGNGADCGSVEPNGSCFVPNNLVAHASYAFNNYWQRTKLAGGTCDFGGTAMLITDDPSFNGCHFNYN